MPEGPEIRRAADKVARVLVDNRIETVGFGLPQLERFEKKLAGNIVTAVDTRGKAMLTRFDNGLTIYSHNQLYGRWYTVRRPRVPRTNRQLRIELCTETHKALLYSASDIDVLNDDQLLTHPFLSRVGPDILDRELDYEHIVERLRDPLFRNRSLGSLYLDQRFLAGNGNYLRSEILWAAGLDPGQKPAGLAAAELKTLAEQTIRLARRSYRTRGVTLAPVLARKLKADGLAYQAYRFYVFGREGLPCHRCRSPIERRTMGSRNLFVCPICQHRKRENASV
jgi:endonuclease-8